MNRENRLCTVIIATLLLSSVPFLQGCGGGGGGTASGGGAGRAVISVKWPSRSRLIPAASNSIKATFKRGDEIIASQVLARPTSGNQTTATFENLKLGDLVLTAVAYPNSDATGVAQSQGNSPVTIVNGQTASVTLTMDSTIDHIDVAPSTVTIAPGGTGNLTGTARDSAGSIVLLSSTKVTWATDNPAVALVNSAGKVTGVSDGLTTVRFTDTESNKAGSASVSVKTGGPLSFGQPLIVATPVQKDGITAGDMDGDGNPDIVVCSVKEIGLLFGRGDGTFDPYVRVVSRNVDVVNWEVSDLDGDGRPEILYTDADGMLIAVRNVGGRTFSPIQLLDVNGVSGFYVADVTKDGRPDIAIPYWGTSNYRGSATLFVNSGNFTFTSAGSMSHAGIGEGAAVGDLNGDGTADMALTYETSTVGMSGVTIGFGNVGGGFVLHQEINFGTMNMISPHIEDLNGDGKPDLVMSHYWGHAVAVFMNQGDGTMGPVKEYASPDYPLTIRVADMNRDGLPDLVVANAGTSHISVYRNLGGGQFADAATFETGGGNCRTLYIADFNKDGKPDVCVESEPDSFACVLLNTTP